jgi:hypothetical protein
MILWTIQHYHAFEQFLKTGVLRANEDYIEDFWAYDWMGKKMIESGIMPPKGVRYPIWAWYQWEGERKRRDMRLSAHAKRGEKIVQLTIEVDDQDVLLSDFLLFHYVLNYWYLPEDENDDSEFESKYESLLNSSSSHERRLSNIQTDEMKQFRSKIESSWDRIFFIEKEDDGWLYGKIDNKSIQATFWELRLDQIVKAEHFIAK